MILDLNSKYNQSVPAFKSGSNVVIEVLPWLVDQPWNDLALAYITALRREYPTISDEQFAEKRCAFLRVMLERAISTGLYYRPFHKVRDLNSLAIQNIQALLDRYNAG